MDRMLPTADCRPPTAALSRAMIRRLLPILRKATLGLLSAPVRIVWVVLVADTAGLAQRAATPPRFPTPALPASTATPRAPRIVVPPPAQVLQDIRPAPEQRLAGFHPKTGRYIAAWLPESVDSVNRQSFEANADILDEISPFWYATNARGAILRDGAARDKALVDLAHSKNVLVIPTIHNIMCSSCPDPVPTVLNNPDRRAQHIRNIVDEVLANDYDGIDIDYEMLDSSLRDEYSAFITELAKALHEQGKQLTIAVHAKTSDYGGLGGFQDWVVLG